MGGYVFRPLDTWFFKEARPMDGFGGAELGSVFPPPVRTVLGALRAAAGDSVGVDWDRYPDAYSELARRIGDSESYGELKAGGVFPTKSGEILYPLPLHIVYRQGSEAEHGRDIVVFSKMTIGEHVACDLGKIKLPQLPHSKKEQERFNTYDEHAWVTSDDLVMVLSGGVPNRVFTRDELIAYESRVGIARDNKTRIVQEGMLYMTRHLRLHADVAVAVEIDGFDGLIERGVVRLGGEGRGAAFDPISMPKIPKPTQPKGVVRGAFLSLLTPASLDPQRPIDAGVVSACVGKAFREGGFDMKGRRSRAARAYLPAGSTWFVEMDDKGARNFIDRWHETKIGDEQALGRGRIVCGYWIK